MTVEKFNEDLFKARLELNAAMAEVMDLVMLKKLSVMNGKPQLSGNEKRTRQCSGKDAK